MIDDRAIWARAQHLIIRRGEAARAFAGDRAAELGVAGDVAVRNIWLRILDRVAQEG